MGRWTAPDPYNGSYDLANPQSLNRYAYAMNNPLIYVDPSGKVVFCSSVTGSGGLITPTACEVGDLLGTATCGPECGVVLGAVAAAVATAIEIFFAFDGRPAFKGSLLPRPGVNSMGTLSPMSRAACASQLADSQYSIAANTSGASPQNPAVQAMLGNGISGIYNLWNSPDIGDAMNNLAIGGYNPGIPTSSPISGGIAGAATNGLIQVAMTNIAKVSTDAVENTVGLLKLGYDGSSWLYAYTLACN